MIWRRLFADIGFNDLTRQPSKYTNIIMVIINRTPETVNITYLYIHSTYLFYCCLPIYSTTIYLPVLNYQLHNTRHGVNVTYLYTEFAYLFNYYLPMSNYQLHIM